MLYRHDERGEDAAGDQEGEGRRGQREVGIA